MYILILISIPPYLTNFVLEIEKKHSATVGPPGVLGFWGEWLFIFRVLGSNGNYFRGSREQAHIFEDLGSPAKSKKIKEKPPFCLIF